MSADGDGGGGGAEGEAFVELLLQEVRTGDMECPSVQMLVDIANSGDSDTVADALCYLVEAGLPDKAAGCLRHIMVQAAKGAQGGTQSAGPTASAGADDFKGSSPTAADASAEEKPSIGKGSVDYSVASRILNRLIEMDNLPQAQELVKFMLVARETDPGRGSKMLDCYDVSMILGSMVPINGGAESAGRLLFALYSSEAGEDTAASQTLVPFILGTLVDHSHADWAVELGKQLMYTTLEEIEAGAGEYDYSVLGWCLAQMVWYGRADWASRLCLDLESQQMEWYNTSDLLNAVAGWGDSSYSMTIRNFMQDARAKEARGN